MTLSLPLTYCGLKLSMTFDLLGLYCLDGNIAGATTVLEQMKAGRHVFSKYPFYEAQCVILTYKDNYLFGFG